ncbi:hypothetical protein AMTRI_Chr13g123080 [Amborella trichopoda]|uniref:Uncharacterized protein n=1 Tax=Amborella trichopoda TaxID=13333 RepID=U5D1G2_AMBTC|nr:hypothetical protein AMTR_s00033p00084740 [Amborella trichopoda]
MKGFELCTQPSRGTLPRRLLPIRRSYHMQILWMRPCRRFDPILTGRLFYWGALYPGSNHGYILTSAKGLPLNPSSNNLGLSPTLWSRIFVTQMGLCPTPWSRFLVIQIFLS